MQPSKRMRFVRFALAGLGLLPVAIAGETATLSPFYTDGCSLFPDGTLQQQELWQNCCIAHDLQYWAGGSYADRLAADEALEACVNDVGEPAVAKLMMAGVRAGGSPFFPTTYRWAYGWPFGRGYQALSDEDKDRVLDVIDHSDAKAFVPIHPIKHWLQTQKQQREKNTK